MKTTLKEFISGFDFELLKAQKMVVLDIIENSSKESHIETLEGLLVLIDSIQDIAVDEIGMDKYHVFNLSGEADEEPPLSLKDCERIVYEHSKT